MAGQLLHGVVIPPLLLAAPRQFEQLAENLGQGAPSHYATRVLLEVGEPLAQRLA